MKSILKYNWLIVLLVTTSLVVFAQDIEHHDYWNYYTFYLRNGEKIKVKENRHDITANIFDKEDNAKYDGKSKSYTLINEDGKRIVKLKDIDHSVLKRYKHDVLIINNYSIETKLVKDYVEMNVLLKLDKYYFCYASGAYKQNFKGEYIPIYYYYIIDKMTNEALIEIKPKDMERDFPQYLGDLTEFMSCLEKNKFNTKKCDGKLVFLAAWKYAHEYYKDSPFYEDKLSTCEKEMINQE